MKTVCQFTATLTVLLLARTLPAEPTNAPLRLAVDLVDGSYLIGAPSITSMPIRTSYAQMEIAFAKVHSVRMGEDRKTASLVFNNGDRLTGVVDLELLQIEAIFGRISLEIRNVHEIQVLGADPNRRGLILYYSFDNDTRMIEDLSGKGKEGTVHGARWVRNGKFGGALEFDGTDDYVTTPALSNQGDVTWSVWIRPFSFPTVHNTFAQFLGLRGHAWVHNSDNTSLYFAYQDHHGGSGLALCYTVQGETAEPRHVFRALPQANTWYHVAATTDKSGRRLYLNGKLLDSSKDTTRFGSACPMIIGANDNGPQRYFRGLIDEVMIFERALSETEIGQMFRSMPRNASD